MRSVHDSRGLVFQGDFERHGDPDTIARCLANMKVIDALMESAKSGAWV